MQPGATSKNWWLFSVIILLLFAITGVQLRSLVYNNFTKEGTIILSPEYSLQITNIICCAITG